MVYRKFLRLFSAAFVLITLVGQQLLSVTAEAQAAASGAGSKPNIILIVGDDVAGAISVRIWAAKAVDNLRRISIAWPRKA